MTTRERITAYVRRAMCLVAALAFAGWAASMLTRTDYFNNTGSRQVVIAAGGAAIVWRSPPSLSVGILGTRFSPEGPTVWLPRLSRTPGFGRMLLVPLWIPFVLTGLPAAYLLWRNRRSIPPNHCCTCGYDLTGNVSGVCPECGAPT